MEGKAAPHFLLTPAQCSQRSDKRVDQATTLLGWVLKLREIFHFIVNGMLAEVATHLKWRRITEKLAPSLLFYTLTAWGQAPRTAGMAPVVEGSVGYCYVNLDVPATGRGNLNGVDVSLTADFLPRLGIKLDGSYARAGNIFESGQTASALSYMAGPVFYPLQWKRITVYTHALLGGARVRGEVDSVAGGYLVGYSNEFAWAAGGGVQYRLTPQTKLQFGADYLHTAMFGPSIALQGQNNLRAVASIVWLFGKRKDY